MQEKGQMLPKHLDEAEGLLKGAGYTNLTSRS